MIVTSVFSAALKLANIALVFKKASTNFKESHRHVFCLMFPKYMNAYYSSK